MQYHHVTRVLLRIETRAREFFESIPFLHAFLAGVGVILFWRGAWDIADIWGLTAVQSMLIGAVLLGGVGLFVQTFVGNAIIIKSVKKEAQVEKNTEKKIEDEEITLLKLSQKIDTLNAKIDAIPRQK